jgi:hypothetical protein
MSESSDETRQSDNPPDGSEDEDVQTLRRQVEEKYDFDDFGPEDMAEMTHEEWEVAFDLDSWITGAELLERVEADLKQRVIERDVFARIEREDDYLLAYSDSGFAVVYPDGSVQGEGTVLRDVKPTVALASMESYDVPDVPDGEVLPAPSEVPDSGSELGNNMLQLVAFVQLLAGVVLFGGWVLTDASIIALVAALGFIFIAIFLLFTVANARLSERFRSEQFKDRLRAMNVDSGERPEFLPVDADGNLTLDPEDATQEAGLPDGVRESDPETE